MGTSYNVDHWQPALGQDVQLGMLYNARTSQFFGGVSLWDNNVVNAKMELDEKAVQNADFYYSYSLEEARKNDCLDLEGSLSLDLKIFRATGSAAYLNDKKSSAHEARVDMSCTVVRRTRRIPQEVLASMKYEKYLENPEFTHFVAEVTEGGSATLSFVRSCSSDEEVKKLTGDMKASIMMIPIKASATVGFTEQESSLDDNVKISYSGALAETVSNFDDAHRIAREMPTKLANQLNTLRFKLLPLSVLDSKANRLIRTLDAGLVMKTAAALKAGTSTGLDLSDLVAQEVFQNQFPIIRTQILNLQAAFSAATTEFTKQARCLLPELRDGTTDEKAKITELEESVALYRERTDFAEQFVKKKYDEARVLRRTVATLMADGFQNDLGGLTTQSILDGGSVRLLLSFGGPSIRRAHHPLQASIEFRPTKNDVGCKWDKDYDSECDDSDDEDEEWFEDQQVVANVKQSCEAIRQQRLMTAPGANVVFGVTSMDKAYRPGKAKKTKTSIGDLILYNQGRYLIVTGMLPKAPAAPEVTVKGQTITVAWHQDRDRFEELAMPTTGFSIKYRRRPNPLRDGAFPRANENETFTEVHYDASQDVAVLGSLSDDCDHEVAFCIQTIVGGSAWSAPVVVRTDKQPSVASRMVDFYTKNQVKLSRVPLEWSTELEDTRWRKPWEIHSPKSGSGKKTLFLGLTEIARRHTKNKRSQEEVAVRIVDVAVEFKPEIEAAPIGDQDNTVVAVFVGTSGHGKSTEINAFISYLLGGEIDDPARVIVVDDRGAHQTDSVTQIVTCFRIRPLSPLFKGKTMLIVDTPGYGDSRGPERDAFVTRAMSEFFKTVSHVNAIILTCRANEARTTFLSPVSTYVFSLFAKDVRRCLRTIYTFSDAGAPLARDALHKLGWPVENREIAVNNSAFTIDRDCGQHDTAVRDGWLLSVRGQFQVMHMLLRMPPVSTENSALVTQNRIKLEHKCELAEKKILRTANEAQNLIASLDALAGAVGAAPGTKVKVVRDKAVQRPVSEGTATTLCLDCNVTCHEVCMFGDDDAKKNCVIMNDGKCTMCKGHCSWDRHKNAGFTIAIEKEAQWLVPDDLIRLWNTNNNTLEGALLTSMDVYLQQQDELRMDIIALAKLSGELTSAALLHDRTALIEYMETLIQSARVRGAGAAQLAQLTTAKNTLILEREVHGKGERATRDSMVLLDIIGAVRREMGRRMRLSPRERAWEEEKSCSIYNDLREKLPLEIRDKAPYPLKKEGLFSRGALYPENLRAVVKLVQVVLADGGVVAALVTSSGGR